MTLGRVAGIPVRLHSSFLILGAALVGWYALSSGLAAAVDGLVLAVLIFGSVVLHELGHALAARAFGIGTRDITLYPFGGIAALRGEPRSPAQELVVAGAGPAVNFVLAVLALPLALGGSGLAITFLVVNLGMALFNLVPAFPMDGGRVLRALLAPRHGYYGATARALGIGRAFGWLMVAAGFFLGAQLWLVGGFLLYATWQEERRLRLMAHLGRTPWQDQGPVARVVATPPPGAWTHPAV